MVAITIIVILLAVFGVSGLIIYKLIQSTAPEADVQTFTGRDASSNAKDFLEFKDIKDNIIDLGGYQYRAIIECSSINYNLKSQDEQSMVEISFQRLLNSLTYPIMIFVGTRMIDNTKVVENLEEDAEINVQKFPKMKEYAENYIEHMKEICYYINNNKQKKKYIVVPYGDAVGMNELTHEELEEFSKTELLTRVAALRDNIEAIGLKAKVLNDAQIGELLYAIQHRNNYHIAKYIMDGEFTPLIVNGDNIEAYASKELMLKTILKECDNKIKTALVDYNLPDDELKLYSDISKMLSASSTLISAAETLEEIKKINFEEEVENYENVVAQAEEIRKSQTLQSVRTNGFNDFISDEDIIVADTDENLLSDEESENFDIEELITEEDIEYLLSDEDTEENLEGIASPNDSIGLSNDNDDLM